MYFGGTSVGCYIRNEGHCKTYGKSEGTEEGFMWNHAREGHGGIKDLTFMMKRINEVKEEREILLMTSKNEY